MDSYGGHHARSDLYIPVGTDIDASGITIGQHRHLDWKSSGVRWNGVDDTTDTRVHQPCSTTTTTTTAPATATASTATASATAAAKKTAAARKVALAKKRAAAKEAAADRAVKAAPKSPVVVNQVPVTG